MTYRPNIGITMRLELETRRFYLGRDYSEAIEAVGGVPVHLPLIPKREFISAALASLDGLLLPGSDTDVDPRYFGEDPHPKLKKVVPEKDETEMLVLAEAERLNLSVLAICYGTQVLNVYRGGDLYQDIESQIVNSAKHQQGQPLARGSHAIRTTEGSRIQALVLNSERQNGIYVNSHHHQAIRKVGRDLTATAWANDGVVECIEDTRSDRYVLGVQWHPELSWETDKLSRTIFDDFVKQCAVRRKSYHGELEYRA